MARAMAAYCFWAGLAPWAQVSVRWGQPIHTRSCGANSAGIKKPSALGVDSDSVIVRIRFPPNRTIACRGRVTRSLKPRDGRRPFPGKGRGARRRFSRSRTGKRRRNQVRGDKTHEGYGREIGVGGGYRSYRSHPPRGMVSKPVAWARPPKRLECPESGATSPTKRTLVREEGWSPRTGCSSSPRPRRPPQRDAELPARE